MRQRPGKNIKNADMTTSPASIFPLPMVLFPDTLKTEVIGMKFQQEPGRIFTRNETGQLLAEVTFPEQNGLP